MAVNIGGWKKTYVALAAESGRAGTLTFGGLSPAAESEEEAAVMMADAGTDAEGEQQAVGPYYGRHLGESRDQ